MSNRLRSWFIAVPFVVVAGCALEQEPINRVQPDYFDKSFFVGKDFVKTIDDPEFYSQGTLVDVGYGAGQDGLFTSTYAQPLTRVKWTVQKDLLIARLAYERITGADGKGTGKATHDGLVVAAFPIISHFDIQRIYNPATGEQSNVIDENQLDRPWTERQYIRVDWSRNLSTDNFDYDTLSQMGVYGGVSYEPLAYSVLDPKHPDAPRYDPEAGYLDITNKAFARPLMVDLSIFGGGVMPACWFDADFSGGSAPSTGCSPVEITIRQSFRKVEDNDYEPADWDGFRFQSFGAFTTDRHGYARNYGMTDTQKHRFINRYNLWQRSHVYADAQAMTGPVTCFTPGSTPVGADPHRDNNGDGTEDECASVGRGSRCDTFSQKCTLPLRDRKEKPVVWYFSDGSSLDFFEPTRDATHEWDVALRSAVVTGRYAECKRTHDVDCENRFPVYFGQQDDNQDAIDLAREVDDCRGGRTFGGQNCESLADRLGQERGYSPGVIALAKMPEMLVLCHSPVEAADPAPCASADQRLPAGVTAVQCAQAYADGNTDDFAEKCHAALNVRKGDLRYHLVNAIRTPQTPSPWGIMVDSNDPLTGETVAASINVWTHVNDLWSQGVVDMARYIKGELTTADVTEGTYVREWASAAEASTTQGSLPKLTKEQRHGMLAELLGADAEKLKSDIRGLKDTAIFAEAKQLARDATAIRADALAPSSNKPIYEARRRKALNTRTEAELTTKMMQSYAGGVGRLDSQTMSEFASPLRGANPNLQREVARAKELALADRGACIMHESPAPFAIADLADILQAKFGQFDPKQSRTDQVKRADAMRRYMAQKAHYAVVTHEMGHSIGLRHNFVSSSDAFNYRPQYWQLRTDNGTNNNSCTTLDPTGACVGPRYNDPVTVNERNNLITMFMQSSTMDYAGEATQDLMGLGAYDFAAARMFYGDVAAVFKDADVKAGTPRGSGAMAKLDNFGGILGFQYQLGDGQAATDIHYSQLQKEFGMIHGCRDIDVNKFKPTYWNEDLMGKWSPLIDGMIVTVQGKASKCKQRPVDYVAWSDLRGANSTNTRSGATQVDAESRVRFPYGFATDRWADVGNLSVYRHDNGADPYELFDFLITQQEVNHIFDNYRRGRETFSVRGATSRSLSRYNEKLRDAAKGLGLMANIYKDFSLAQGYDFDTLWASLGAEFFGDNLLVSGLGFDHFTKQMARPQSGPHMMGKQGTENILRSSTDTVANAGATVVTIPNGATGYFGNVSPGGRPLENSMANDQGEYDAEFTLNAGSYYDKASIAMLMTESMDNFISDSRRDFLDSRYRAVSVADVFPEGYRRWLGNNLTGDEMIKSPRLAQASNRPIKDAAGYPAEGIGFTSWWKPVPDVCFPRGESLSCDVSPAATMPIEAQIGWEQQKFLIAWTLMYLPENQQQTWLNQMGIWEVGADTDPGFGNRIEFHSPNGKTYIAHTSGKEVIFGKTVQKGIAARMLEWANQLLVQAYVVTNGPDLDGDGSPDWYLPTYAGGKSVVKFDPSIQVVTASGGLQSGRPGCNATDNSSCTCSSNRYCIELGNYEEVPFFMRQAMRDYGLADPSMKGLY
jgi:hypothetical protein